MSSAPLYTSVRVELVPSERQPSVADSSSSIAVHSTTVGVDGPACCQRAITRLTDQCTTVSMLVTVAPHLLCRISRLLYQSALLSDVLQYG